MLVVAPPEAHRDPAWLARLLRERRIDTCHFVPSMLTAFLDEPRSRGLVMKRIFCSGEELPATLRDPGALWRPAVWALLFGEYGRYVLARAGLSALASLRREMRDP